MVQFLIETSWWVPGYGLLGALLTLPWSAGAVRRTGPRPAAYFNILMTLLALVHCALLLWAVWDMPPQYEPLPWLSVLDLDITLSLELSRISVGAALIITALSLIAQVFALGYLEKDWALARFYALMGFFEGAMSGLVLSNSLFLSYALLEMLTLSTYLLVGFWYAQPLVVTAARDAFLTKRVGDVLLLMGVVAVGLLAGDLDFPYLEAWAETANLSPLVANLVGLALIAGPVGKCAQFPLNLWLDEAMEGPNPASILRNSVVVACGAYVLIRMQPIVALSPVALTTLMVLGTVTAVGASLVAIAQIDIKRALSHTTSAYLGLVFLAVGLQQHDTALLLLLTHGIAKALLFMCTGSVILTTSTQDLREMGALGSRMPATASAFIIGALGSVGLVPMGCFWAMYQWALPVWRSSPGLLAVLLIVNGLTAFGLTRVFGLVFCGEVKPKTRRAPEAPWPIAVPMVSVAIATLLVPVMLHNWGLLPDWRDVNLAIAGALFASSITGCGLGVFFYMGSRPLPQPGGLGWKSLQDFLAHDFRIEQLYKLTVVFAVAQGSRLTAWFDRYVVDGMVNLLGVASLIGGESLKYTVSGRARHYLLTVFIGVILGIAWLGWMF
ncbi:NAD(P)H-quinone oxidoreductase subunit F [Thermoleptolyngbya sichuanensis A183]|uniref:NAD(P)H-quinone oxidoreductase subunit F n=1 Tax=Thermoleptolyngbya sichuanensis A183 TaxID=2737172 RepID=A0A6M8B9A4_9CYAN|nr:NAD(P)H-quinone oxidoreductase subunit F [Thermoleptolyngbya sichuanensis]QKD83999.1 NAD(P)H-quinone oxidoreductase subunit F [Thermoleptolyngbya sichuanensis A183]